MIVWVFLLLCFIFNFCKLNWSPTIPSNNWLITTAIQLNCNCFRNKYWCEVLYANFFLSRSLCFISIVFVCYLFICSLATHKVCVCVCVSQLQREYQPLIHDTMAWITHCLAPCALNRICIDCVTWKSIAFNVTNATTKFSQRTKNRIWNRINHTILLCRRRNSLEMMMMIGELSIDMFSLFFTLACSYYLFLTFSLFLSYHLK